MFGSTRACVPATSSPIGPPNRRSSNVSRGRGVGVDRVAVVIGTRRGLRRHARSLTHGAGRFRRRERRARLAGPLEIRLVAVLRGGELARPLADDRGSRRIGQGGQNAGARTPRRRAGQDRRLVAEHLRVREQPRRDDRLSRPQVLINLERRVRAARARRHEHVSGEQIRAESLPPAARRRRS